MDIDSKVKYIISEQLNVANLEYTDKPISLVEDLGADSLDIVELIMTFEEEFNIEISEEDLNTNPILTVNDAIELVKNKIPQNK
jgi:acyl carrier protein